MKVTGTQKGLLSIFLEFSLNTQVLPESSFGPLRQVLWVLRIQRRPRTVLRKLTLMCVCVSVYVYRTCVSMAVTVAAVFLGLACPVTVLSTRSVPSMNHLNSKEWMTSFALCLKRQACWFHGPPCHPAVSWSPAWYSQITCLQWEPCRMESGVWVLF